MRLIIRTLNPIQIEEVVTNDKVYLNLIRRIPRNCLRSVFVDKNRINIEYMCFVTMMKAIYLPCNKILLVFSAQMNIHYFQGRAAQFVISVSVPSLLLLKHYNSPAIIDNSSLSAGSVAPTERAILPKMLAFSMDVILT